MCANDLVKPLLVWLAQHFTVIEKPPKCLFYAPHLQLLLIGKLERVEATLYNVYNYNKVLYMIDI